MVSLRWLGCHVAELSPGPKATELIGRGELTRSEWEDYASLGIEMRRYRNRVAIRAPSWVMRAPLRTLDDFIGDLCDPQKRDSARRDFANLTSGSTRPFFRDPKVIDQHADGARVSPVQGGGQAVAVGEPIRLLDSFRPVAHAVYAFAADYSISKDATGFALVHYDQTTERPVLDFSGRIKARHGERIDYEVIRVLVRELRDRGFRVGKVGFDQFQANDSFTILEREGFKCEVVKFSDSLMGCNTVQELMASGRLVYGFCDEVFLGEAKELQDLGKRVDHLKAGGFFNSKDVWDSVVNATFLLMGMVKEEHGEFLQTSDLKSFAPLEISVVHPLTAEEKVLPEKDRVRRQLPHNRHALLAFVHCRYNTESDSDTVAVAVAAVSMGNNECRLLDAFLWRRTPPKLAESLAQLELDWRGKGYFRTRRTQSLELFIPELHFMEKVEDALHDRAKHLALTPLDVTLSADLRIRAAQAAAREGKLTFPVEAAQDLRMRQLVGQLVAYPFVPNNHLLLAVEGVYRAADAADFSTPRFTSRVISLPGGGS